MSSSTGVKVSSLAKKFDDSNKRHTVSFNNNSNKAKDKIDKFEKVSSSISPVTKDDSNINRSSSVMIKPHSNNNLQRMSSSPNFSSSPKNSNPPFLNSNQRNVKTNSIRKTNFEQQQFETNGNSVSERIARIERKPKQQSTTPFHHDRVKRNFNIRNRNTNSEEAQLTERFSKLLQQLENEKLDSPNYKEAMNLFERKSIRFTPSSTTTPNNTSWSNSEEDRLHQLLTILREEEMKRLEMLEKMLRRERESIRFNSKSTSSSPILAGQPQHSNNIKTLHTNSLMDKIKQERNEIVNKEMIDKKKMNENSSTTTSTTSSPPTPTVNTINSGSSGKSSLKDRPLPTPGTIVSTPLTPTRKSDACSSNSSVVDYQDFIEQKKKRLTMLPTNADDLFQMW